MLLQFVDPPFQLVQVMLEGKTLQDTAFAKYQPFELNQIQGFPDDLTMTPEVVAAQSRTASTFSG